MKKVESRLNFLFRDENNQIEIDFLKSKLKIKHRFVYFFFQNLNLGSKFAKFLIKKLKKFKNGKKGHNLLILRVKLKVFCVLIKDKVK